MSEFDYSLLMQGYFISAIIFVKAVGVRYVLRYLGAFLG